MVKKVKKPAEPSADAIKRAKLTEECWAAYQHIYSKIRSIESYAKTVQDGVAGLREHDMERLRKLTLEMGRLANKNKSKPAAKTKK